MVRRQRRLERKIASIGDAVDQEKATRDQIAELLKAAGVKTVTCDGYDVVRTTRAGRTSINADKLLGAGVAAIDIAFATETGKESTFATVRPMKGASVAVKAPRKAA